MAFFIQTEDLFLIFSDSYKNYLTPFILFYRLIAVLQYSPINGRTVKRALPIRRTKNIKPYLPDMKNVTSNRYLVIPKYRNFSRLGILIHLGYYGPNGVFFSAISCFLFSKAKLFKSVFV